MGALACVLLIAFYFLPWLPFLVAGIYLGGWIGLVLTAISALGPIAQAILISLAYGSD